MTEHPQEARFLRESWGWLMVSGIGMIVLGFIAIGMPVLATVTVEMLLGVVLVIAGMFWVADAFWAHQWSGFFLKVGAGALTSVIGLLMLVRPVTGAVTLTVLFAGFLLVKGVIQMILSLEMRALPDWGWRFFSGIVSLILAALIISGWPGSGLWIIGLFIGIDLIFTGWTSVAVAMAWKNMAKEAVTPSM